MITHQSLKQTKLRERKQSKKKIGANMSRYSSTGSFFAFLVGIGVGAAAVILLGSKRIDELHDEVSEALNDGLDQVRTKTKDIRRQAQRTLDTAQQKVQEAIDSGAAAFHQAKGS